MLVEATKYADVRGQAAQPGSRPSQTPARASASSSRRPASPAGMPALFVPKHKALVDDWDAWLWRELREGGRLKAYLDREKATSTRRMRSVARRQAGFRQSAKSDLRLLAAVPAREYHRWRGEDPDFWKDNSNLRSWRRSNPDACVYL